MWGLRNFFAARVFTSIDPLCQWRQFVRFCWRLHKEGVVSAARRGGGAKKDLLAQGMAAGRELTSVYLSGR